VAIARLSVVDGTDHVDRLNLPMAHDTNRRVLAVLAYLRGGD
jgi:hypothetical protein